jgi:hypothetical protein
MRPLQDEVAFLIMLVAGGYMAIRIVLSKDELQALKKLAWRERRRVGAQAALIVRRELERTGLLVSLQSDVVGDMPNTQQDANPENCGTDRE